MKRPKKIMKKLLIIGVAALSVTYAGAQTATFSPEPEATLTLSLEEAIEIALDENPTILVAELEIERYDYVRKETLGNLYPQFGLTGSYTRNIIVPKLGGSFAVQGKNEFATAANLSLPLFAPGVYSTLKLTDEQMRAAVESARGSRIDLVAEVKKAYYNILLAERSLEVLYISEANLTQTVNDTRTQYENGLASEYDYITAEVQLSNLKPTIIQTKNSIEVAKMLLKMYLSIPEWVDVELEGSLDSMAESMLGAPVEFITDISENSELRYMELQERILEQQLKLQKTQRMPTLAAFGNFQITGNDLDRSGFNFGGGEPEPQKYKYTWQRPLYAGVQVSIPIFSGFINTNREKQIKNNISQLRLQRDYLEENTKLQVNTALNALITAEQQMIANSITISQAQKGYDISRTRYDADMGTMLEVNTAEVNLTQARLNYTQSIYDYLSALADYDRIIGKEE